MGSEPDTGQCASKEAEPRMGVSTRTLGLEGGWIGEGPTSIGERNKCQLGRRAPKGGGL